MYINFVIYRQYIHMVQDLKGTQDVQSKVSLLPRSLPGGISVTNFLFISLEVLCASIRNCMHIYTHMLYTHIYACCTYSLHLAFVT